MNDQIEMIDKVLRELQKNIAQRAVDFFRIGWVIFFGGLVHYLLAYLNRYGLIQILWIIVPGLCVLVGIISNSRRSDYTSLSTSGKLLVNVWGVVGVSMIYLSLIAPRLGFMPWDMGIPMVFICMFISVSITGLAIKHTPTIYLSLLWIAGSVAASILDPAFDIHILMAVVLLAFLLPSYLIKAKYL